MHVSVARDTDLDAVATLVNSSYRGDSSRAGWTTEANAYRWVEAWNTV